MTKTETFSGIATVVLWAAVLLLLLAPESRSQSRFPPYIPQDCTLATLTTCVQQVDGSVAVITDGNAADAPNRCDTVGGAGGGSDVVTCERLDGVWYEVIPNPTISGGGGLSQVFCNVSLENPLTTDFVFCPVLSVPVAFVELSCVATGGTVPDVQVDAMVCNTSGGGCFSVALVTVTALETPVSDLTFSSNPTADQYWAFDVGPVTTAPDWIHCQLEAAP